MNYTIGGVRPADPKATYDKEIYSPVLKMLGQLKTRSTFEQKHLTCGATEKKDENK